MLSLETVAEARRQFEICNACRYCEGVCPVFPALERRTEFHEPDVLFLANLCHDCQTCYHVCPFTPPHSFAVNIPVLMSGIRQSTYRQYAWPSALAGMLERHRGATALAVSVGFAVALGAAMLTTGAAGLLSAQVGPGAFYRVIPWLWMFVPAMILSIWAILAAMVGFFRFWKATAVPRIGPFRLGNLFRPASGAVADGVTLRHMRGGGPGCDYPEDTPSRSRRRLHGLVFWGFVATFASTTAAFIKQEFFGELPPYPWISEPVILGTVGGVAMIIGAFGLLRLKARGEQATRLSTMVDLDRTFLWVVVTINVTGIALLVARETAAMPLLVALHLALVGAFFVTAPYSKFVHFVYRIAALIQNRVEQRQEALQAER